MEPFLQFQGTWRTYQVRVLKNADKYLADGKIHIVAAPGSGKTTLGIELIARMGKPALILAPSITIRQQWEARIAEAFLPNGAHVGDYCSQDLKKPAPIMIATYQALHSAMTRYAGTLEETDEAETDDEGDSGLRTEQVDFAGVDLVSVMKENGIGVLCLDECHHLRSEWWKALEEFKKQMGDLKVIALTATPPYDSTPAMWTRYMDMCGEIDEEITIPELVKEGSLCPHQDYVYFNYPTAEEMNSIVHFQEKSTMLMEELLWDDQLATAVLGHPFIRGSVSDDAILENPSYLASLLIFLNQKQLPYPKRFLKLLGVKKLPEMETKWMEILLQKMLYEDEEAFPCNKTYREMLIARLKQDGLIERRKVMLTDSTTVEKLLLNSKGKIDSIVKIAESEYDSMGDALRMLVLTDYIRKAYEKKLGADLESDTPILGVLPFFEVLRKHFAGSANPPRLGVLCGSMVIIPADAKDALLQILDDKKVTFSAVGQLREQDYVQVKVQGDGHVLTSAVTEIFRLGYIQIIIGTKSLLGEGWDSPCINSLILASFVGSFMLSNQMRGRAIRVMRDNQEKTSNIWHLVCIKPTELIKKEEKEGNGREDLSEDFKLLERRMEHFLGLHYAEDTIESGLQRLSIIEPPYRKSNIERINKQMLTESKKRAQLKKRWNHALAIYDKMEIVDESEVPDRMLTVAVLYEAFLDFFFSVAFFVVAHFVAVFGGGNEPFSIVMLFILFGIVWLSLAFPKLFMAFSPYRRLKTVGNGIRKALEEQNLFEECGCKVVVEDVTPTFHGVYLRGGSGRDKALFAQCVAEFFGVIDNQRYLLVRKFLQNGKTAYYAVPEIFGRKKETAEAFAKCMKRYIRHYELVYTRSEQGRKLLLKGRVHAFSNRDDRLINKKKVKGALE